MPHRIRGWIAGVVLLSAGAAAAQTPDQAAISGLLHTTFDRPASELVIAPVVVAGNHAIAGWTQGEMGGRALLRRRGQNWVLILCAGDGIKSRDALVKAGIPIEDASALERNLAAAEGKLPLEQVAMFSRFEGVMMMDDNGTHPRQVHPHAKN